MAERRYIYDGKSLIAPEAGQQSTVYTYDDLENGVSMEPDYGDFPYKLYNTMRNWNVKGAVMHWGGEGKGKDGAEQLVRVFISKAKRAKKKAKKSGKKATGFSSSHFAISDKGIWQLMDARKFSWHAGSGNNNKLGVDITQGPEEDELDDMLEHGFDVEVVDNTTGRGPKRVLSLDKTTAQTVREWIYDMHEIFGIPLKVPRKPNGDYFFGTLEKDEHKAWDGFLGHFHISGGKWDIAPWWAQIWDPIFAGTAQRDGSIVEDGGNESTNPFLIAGLVGVSALAAYAGWRWVTS